ncbi:Lipase maturation factor [Streptomyces sp. 1222.5]|uniref:lipase maturation factor family protein n=1 Tax=unclassified Streptomyces TaxID=2593676 RepID=UPI0008979E11|nr:MULTISPECIES: lipase maturation factor family protein [unclassified Streptomyces]PKW11452.1 lipase maturation factor [Streptomyces sp. 5112.2]SEB78618.1 Lipase maturation factor [Streptomyces sp. 1222.5]SEE11868.1 Lipase maturation factor [Streptomyces sp. 2231.1]
MDWFTAPDYWWSRLVLQRGLAALYLVAFLTAALQFRALLGERGMLPIPRFVARVPFRRAPSLFQWRYSDGFFAACAWAGCAVSAALLAGADAELPLWAGILLWLVPWALYLSIVNVGQTWYAFGWESLLLETGFLAAFLGNDDVAPPVVVLFLLRWILFRVEFGAGLIKLRGDACWRKLTCLDYHHETQPMPGPLSWFFHHLPKPVHRAEVAANHLTQLVVPVLLFTPQPVASAAAALMIVTQLWLVLSGNFSWLNWVTIVLALSALRLPGSAPSVPPAPLWYEVLLLAVAALLLFLSYHPVTNMISRRQVMNRSFDPLHLVNTYGAFGSVSRVRYEVVVEGTLDEGPREDSDWREYEFKGKPGDPRRWPRQFAPYHLRLDWLMWFAALSPAYAGDWFGGLVERLLENDRDTLRLLRRSPFPPDTPPRYVRARLFRYRYTSRRELRETGACWERTYVREYLPPTRLASAARMP